MKIIKTTFFFALTILSFMSCSVQNDRNDRLVDRAGELLVRNPDSTLVLLSEIVYPKLLNEPTYNKYLLLQVQAKEKSGKTISRDSLLLGVQQYYADKGDMQNAALAGLYGGRVLHTQNNVKEAMKVLLEAHKQAAPNESLQGAIQRSIGDLHFKQFIFDEAIASYRLSLEQLRKAKNHEEELKVYINFGLAFLMKYEMDSAMSYLNKGLVLAQQHNNPEAQAKSIHNIGLVYENMGKRDSARAYMRRAIPLYKKKDGMAKSYLSIAYLFNAENNKDSTSYYLNKAQLLVKDEDSPTMSAAYKLLAKSAQDKGNYQSALSHQQAYSNQLMVGFTERNNLAILEIQRKYNYELMVNDNNRLLIEKQTISLIVLALLVFILIMTFIFYRKSVKRRNALADAHEKISHLKEMAENYHAEKSSVRTVLLQHFEVLKKVALMDSFMKEDEKKQGSKLLRKFNEIVYKQEKFDWDMIIDTINHAYSGLPNNLLRVYPELDVAEFRICCLTYAELSNTEISILIRMSVNTVQSKKSGIRRKLGIETYGSIVDFLKEKVNNGE